MKKTLLPAMPTIPSLLLAAFLLLSTGVLLVHGRSTPASTASWSLGKRIGRFPVSAGEIGSGGFGLDTDIDIDMDSNTNTVLSTTTRISGGASSSSSTTSTTNSNTNTNSNSNTNSNPSDATITKGTEAITLLRAGATNLDSTANCSSSDAMTGGTIVEVDTTNSINNDNDKNNNSNSKLLSSKESSKVEKKLQKLKTKEEKKKEKKFHVQIAKQLKNRNATNKRRKFMHAAWGMLFASLHHLIPRSRFLPGMTTLTTLTLIMELLRYRKGFDWMNNCLHFVLGKALRKNEMDGKFTGSLYYFSGVTLTSYLFPKSCATLGIVQLAIADPTASYFGRATRHVYWSRINNGFFGLGRNKGILGCLGGAVSCVPLNYRLLSLALVKRTGTTIAKPTVLAISLALGMAGALADLMVPTPALTLPKRVCGVRVPPFHLDDNIVVPVLSGWACVYILAAASIGRNELVLAKYLVL